MNNDPLTEQAIGIAIEVHQTLGPGFIESIYEEAMCVELTARHIPFEQQMLVDIYYKNTIVGQHRLDLIVDGQLILELKAISLIAPIHTAQLVSYLKATRLSRGLIINFQTSLLKDGIKRVVL